MIDFNRLRSAPLEIFRLMPPLRIRSTQHRVRRRPPNSRALRLPVRARRRCFRSRRIVLPVRRDLLILRCVLAGVLQGLTGKSAEISVFAHFGVVDSPLTTDPAQQRLCLRLAGVTTKAVSGLGHVRYP